MRKFLKHSILVLAFIGLALSSVVHASSQSHDFTECSICIFQSSNDVNTTSSEIQVPASSLVDEKPLVGLYVIDLTKVQSPYFGRAPPFIA